jgi:hypothetical protein
MPLVSIVTPSYNQAAFLESTLQSVLRQEGVDLELLVVDGGSTDGSLEIIRRYADPLAWWVSEPDSGQAEAINKGLQRAKGEIVAWLNSDDLYLPGAVAQAAAALEAHPQAGLVFGDALTIDAQGHPLNRLTFGDWGLSEFMSFRIICQPAVFIRRAVLDVSGLLDPSYHFLLDHHLWLRIASLAPVIHVPGLWAAARHHPDAKNVAQAAGFGLEAFRILEWMQASPRLGPKAADLRRQVLGGAHRLNARYLLEGGKPGPALKAYAQALRFNPPFALRHAHRMLYALVSLTGLRLPPGLSAWRRQPPNLTSLPGVESWPGLVFDPK